MRFGAFLPHVGVYGGVRRFLEIGNELVRLGLEFTLFTPAGEKPTWMPCNFRCAPTSELKKGQCPETLMCGDTGMLATLARSPARLKIMFVVGRRYATKYAKFLDRGFVVIGVSSDWKSYLPDVEGYTVAGGVNLDMFHRKASARTPSSKVRLLTFGMPQKEVKGTLTVLRALRELAGRKAAGQGIGGRVKFWLTGTTREPAFTLTLFDRERISLPRWARRLPIETVKSPSQEELVRLYSDSDLFVSCEKSAGWCNSVAEAMACGTPVICSSAGTADIAVDGETALVVPEGDHRAVARAVERMLAEPGLRQRLATAAAERILQFSWQRVCRQLIKIVEKHLGEIPSSKYQIPTKLQIPKC